MSIERNTQLTSALGYNTNNLIFGEPILSTISSSDIPITFRRIPISTRNPDGSIGDLILSAKGFSFGVQENKDFSTGKPNGYQFPIALYTKGGATDEEKEWIKSFDGIVNRCVEHLVENRKDIQKYDLEARDLRRLNPIYWKRVDGEIAPDASPVFYVKLITRKDKTTGEKIIMSQFYNTEDEKIDPMDIQNKMCNANVALKVESIFVGNKISLQVKLYEAEISLIETGMKRLLSTGSAPRKILNTATTPVKSTITEPLDETDDDTGSIVDDDDEEDDEEKEEKEEIKPKPVKKRVVKKIVRKVKKKAV